MSDEVKFIFKTLIKVPCIIVVAYIVLNIFGLFYTWFTLIGLQNVLTTTIANNNYINANTMDEIVAQLGKMQETAFIDHINLVVGTDGAGEPIVVPVARKNATTGANETVTPDAATIGSALGVLNNEKTNIMTKCQYGNYKTIGIQCFYTIQWPLMPREYTNNANADANGTLAADGLAGFQAMDRTSVAYTDNGMIQDDAILEGRRNDARHKVLVPVVVRGQSCGMKYYVDEH